MPNNSAALTHVGKTRDKNQDCFQISGSDGCWIVADGMGGHASGEVASQLACNEIARVMKLTANAHQAIQQAHQTIKSAARDNLAHYSMGTTVVMARVKHNHYQINWVGDSRAYLVSHSQITRLSHDHSLVQQWIDNDIISAQQALTHPKRHIITQSLGSTSAEQLDIGQVSGTLAPDDRLLLCSDGLTDELSDQQIQQILSRCTDPAQAAQQLVDAANHHGGRDNITVIIIDADTGNAHNDG